MSEASDDIAVLQHHLGPQWPGSEAEGRAAMVQILQTVHGYDYAQAEAALSNCWARWHTLCYDSGGCVCYREGNFRWARSLYSRI